MQESRRIEALFEEALELDPKGREDLFARVRREDREDARRLQDLIDVFDSHPGFLSTTPEISGDELEQWFGSGDRPRSVGSLAFLSARDRVGGYELVRVIGFGGMGVVYEAIQRQPRRQVALKLLRATDANPSMLRRFEAEAEILARLQHPSIAQVFEAGVETLEGEAIPYLAMELIQRARTVTDYARENELDEAARLRLFLEVAAAVEHAHEQGVVHRDLKPANILVDAAGRPKIIDFGIARIVDGESASSSAVTQTRGVLGTICYMSPEQLGADDRSVDRRTDVYALGVLLYELLCGALPYDVEQAPLPQIVRAVVHQPPVRPSERGIPLARDLETILLKALRKTREDRYASAAAFAEDLERYLDHEPIAARPPSLTYRLHLLSRRRPGLITSGLVVTTLLVASAVVSGWLWMRGERLQQQADDARSELHEVRSALGSNGSGRPEFEPFASGMVASVEKSLAAAGSDEERARLLTWAVDTLQRLEPTGSSDPELAASIAETYIDLGEAYGSEWAAGPEKVTGAEAAFRRAVEIYTRLVEGAPEDFAHTRRLSGVQVNLAQTLRKLDRFEDALAMAEESVVNAERLNEWRPGDPVAEGALIIALWARGDSFVGLTSPQRGIDDSVRATQLSRALLSAKPDSVRNVCFVAWSAFRVGAWYLHSSENSRLALDAFAEANDHRLQLVQLNPEGPDTASDLLWYTASEVALLEELEGPSAAANRLREFLDGAAIAAKASASETRLAASYAGQIERLGDLLVAAGRRGEAVAVAEALTSHLESLPPDDEKAVEIVELTANARSWTTDWARGAPFSTNLAPE